MIYRKFRRGSYWVIRRTKDFKGAVTCGLRDDIHHWLNRTHGAEWHIKQSTYCPGDPNGHKRYGDIRDFHVPAPHVFTVDIYLPSEGDVMNFVLAWEGVDD